MGAGILGWEADLAYTPQFFENGTDNVTFADSDNVSTVMGNVIIGIPVGGQHGKGVRPYAAAGVGLMKTRVEDATQLFNVDNNSFGYDLGAGVMGFMTDHIGLRGDVRYFRSFQNTEANVVGLEVGHFAFYRASLGVLFRF
jgi:opacity protein-like surface antigen